MNVKYKLNLQQFANPNTNVTTQSSLSDEMKTYYKTALIKMAQEELIHDQFGDKKPLPKNGGKTIEFRKFASLPKATTALTEGVTPDGQSMTVSALTATIAQYGGYVTLSDILELTAIDNNLFEATELIAQQAGRTLDTITRDVLHGGTNVIYAPKSSGTAVTQRSGLDTTCLLTPDLILKARTLLRKNNGKKIPYNGSEAYVAIVHPDNVEVLEKDTNWKDWTKYTDPTKMYKNEVGMIHGVRIIENTEAKIINDNTCPVLTAASGNDPATYYSVYSTIILAAHAYGVTEVEGGGLQHIVKQLGEGDDPLNQRATVGWKATRVAKRLVEEYMVRIESLTPASATEPAN